MICGTNDLPMILTPAEVQQVLGISKNKVYDVFHSEGFPCFRVGKQYRVSKERFFQWLELAEKAS